MGADRITCVFFTVCVVNIHLITAKPFLGGIFYCDVFCDYYDDGVSTSASTTLDILDVWFPCDRCPSSTTTPTTSTTPKPINFILPPQPTGQNVTFMNVNGNWIMSMLPLPNSGATTTAAPATTTAAATTTAGTTTAAAESTTAAPTTAAAPAAA